MKTVSKLLAALVVASPLFAQDPPPNIGFIRMVNAVAAGEGNTEVLVDGETLYPKGYKLGQKTGGIGLPAGSRRITIRKQGVEEGSTSLGVAAGATTTLIAFAERVEPKDPEEEVTYRARILRLKQSDPERGYRLTVISVCTEEEVAFNVATAARRVFEKTAVKRFDTRTMDLGNGRGDVQIKLRGRQETLCGMSLAAPGNYVAVFYNDAEGNIKALTFYDPKFVIAG